MNSHFFKIALRNLWKNKLYSAIKIGGLGIGLATCLLVGLYLNNELSYDAFHEHADRIVRTTMEYKISGELDTSEYTGNKVGPTFKREFPEVEDAVRVISYDLIARYEDIVHEETDIYFADPSFFSIFTFPLLQGNPDKVLQGPNEVVITEKMALKYFGNENPIGKTLQIGSREYLIQALMADPPTTSQIQPHFVGSFASLRDANPERATWWNANYATYLLLTSPSAIEPLQSKIPGYMKLVEGEHGTTGENYLTYNLEPIKDVYLRSSVEGNFIPNGDIRYIIILAFSALIVLLIASITYVNLTTATSSTRAKEIGVSKVIGASKGQLFRQYIGEAAFTTGLALLIGLMVATATLPTFSSLLQRELTWAPLFDPIAFLAIISFCILISLLAGIYPASVMSSYQPVKVLKGTFVLSKSGNWLRKSLIVAQFSISVFLIICTGILFYQLQFIQDRALGYQKDHVLVLPADFQVVQDIDVLKSTLLQNSDIQSVSLTYETPVYIEGGYDISKSMTREQSILITALPADEDFIATTGIELIAGTSFGKRDVEATKPDNQSVDSTALSPILINESQSAQFGWTPEEALNQMVVFNGDPVRIQGVMKDFHYASLHVPIENLVVFPSYYGQEILVRTGSQDLTNTLAYLESIWAELVPHRPFSFHFLSDEVDQLYQSENLIAKLISAITGIAIFMTIIGLFGLAAITAQHRTKEIGIRKVLGASVIGIIGLLSSDLMKMTALAFIASAPFAFFLMKGWLQGFAYHTAMPWFIFFAAGILAFLIAFMTVCSQSLKVVLANPINALRHD